MKWRHMEKATATGLQKFNSTEDEMLGQGSGEDAIQ